MKKPNEKNIIIDSPDSRLDSGSWGSYNKGWVPGIVATGKAIRQWIQNKFEDLLNKINNITPNSNIRDRIEYTQEGTVKTITVKNLNGNAIFSFETYAPALPIDISTTPIYFLNNVDEFISDFYSINLSNPVQSLSASGTTTRVIPNKNYWYIISKKRGNTYYKLNKAVTNNNENILGNFSNEGTFSKNEEQYVYRYIHFDVAPTNLSVTLTFNKEG